MEFFVKPGLPRLMRVPSLGKAFSFGWAKLRSVVEEYWLFYLAIGIVGIIFQLITGYFGSTTIPNWIYSYTVGEVPRFLAIAVSVRLVVPSFRMNRPIVLGIYAIVLMQRACWIPLTIVRHYMPPHAAHTIPDATSLLWSLGWLALSIPVIWTSIKLSLAPTLYAMRIDEDGKLSDAIRESWTHVSGGAWWRVLGLTVYISFICLIIPAIIGFAVDIHRAHTFGTVGALAFGLELRYPQMMAYVALAGACAFVGGIAATVWLQTSLVALATAFIGERGTRRFIFLGCVRSPQVLGALSRKYS